MVICSWYINSINMVMIWGWFIVVFSTTDPELVESDPALVVAQKAMIFMDLRLFTFWEVEIPPQKKSCHFNRETYDKLLDDVGCGFFFTLNLRRSPFLGWFWPHIPLPAGDFHPFLDARGLGRSATGRIRTTGGVPGIQDDLHDGDLWAV